MTICVFQAADRENDRGQVAVNAALVRRARPFGHDKTTIWFEAQHSVVVREPFDRVVEALKEALSK